MISINNSQELIIDKDEEYIIEAEGEVDLSLVFNKSSNLFFSLKGLTKLNIEAKIKENFDVSIFFSNDNDTDIEVVEKYEVKQDGKLVVSYSDFNENKTNRYTEIKLIEEGASGTINSASLVNSDKNYRFIVENVAKNTNGLLNNYAVVLKDGKLMIDAIGKIDKGASHSESHQTSRALSFAPGQKTTILPELLIDENDVKASHAMSIGRMDDDQLYYLMSRGLSIEECTSLVSVGYLYPILENIKDDELKNNIKENLERKLSNL